LAKDERPVRGVSGELSGVPKGTPFLWGSAAEALGSERWEGAVSRWHHGRAAQTRFHRLSV